MGHVEAGHLSHILPDGRVLLNDISFRVGDGLVAALVGPNVPEDHVDAPGDRRPTPQSGRSAPAAAWASCGSSSAQLRDQSTVRDLLLSVSSPRIREAAARLDDVELLMMERDDEPTQMRYARALTEWGDACGYEAEVHWDVAMAALGVPATTTAGGARYAPCPAAEQKRLVLESLRCAARTRCCCSTSPTTTWTCRGRSGWRSSSTPTPEDRPAGQPRPRAARRLRPADHHRRGHQRLDPRRRVRHLRRGAARAQRAAR